MHNDQRSVIDSPETVKSPFANGPFFTSGQVARQLGNIDFQSAGALRVRNHSCRVDRWRAMAHPGIRGGAVEERGRPNHSPSNVDDADRAVSASSILSLYS